MSTQNEVRQKITDQIIAALSDGTKLPPWRKPWRTDANAGHPTNVVSKRGYTGINPLLLDIAATRHDLKSKWWGTFRQWQGMGGMVKRRPVDVPPGEWGTNIIYFKRVAKKTTNEMGEDVEEKFFFMRTYTVFNLDQVDGLFSKLQVGNAPISVTEIEQRCEIAEAAIAATEADIRFGGDRAFTRWQVTSFRCRTVSSSRCPNTMRPFSTNWPIGPSTKNGSIGVGRIRKTRMQWEN